MTNLPNNPAMKEMLGIFEDYLEEKGIQLPSSPSYRYYSHPRKLYRYCWNTESLTPSESNQNKRWAAFIYRVNKSEGQLSMVKSRYFTKRNSAKACALKWYQTAKNKYEAHQRKA